MHFTKIRRLATAVAALGLVHGGWESCGTRIRAMKSTVIQHSEAIPPETAGVAAMAAGDVLGGRRRTAAMLLEAHKERQRQRHRSLEPPLAHSADSTWEPTLGARFPTTPSDARAAGHIHERERTREQIKAERISREQAARSRAAAERIAREQTARDRIAAERIAREQTRRDRIAQERIIRQQELINRLEVERIQKEQEEINRRESARIAREEKARNRNETERIRNRQQVAVRPWTGSTPEGAGNRDQFEGGVGGPVAHRPEVSDPVRESASSASSGCFEGPHRSWTAPVFRASRASGEAAQPPLGHAGLAARGVHSVASP